MLESLWEERTDGKVIAGTVDKAFLVRNLLSPEGVEKFPPSGTPVSNHGGSHDKRARKSDARPNFNRLAYLQREGLHC